MKLQRDDRVDWSDEYKNEFSEKFGSGPFTILNFEEVPEEPDGHCQWLSIIKEVDGKKMVWVSHKNAWLEYRPGPPYMCVPPIFSNILFKKADKGGAR